METLYNRVDNIDELISSVKLPYMAWKVLFLVDKKANSNEIADLLEAQVNEVKSSLDLLVENGLIKVLEKTEEKPEEKTKEETVPVETKEAEMEEEQDVETKEAEVEEEQDVEPKEAEVEEEQDVKPKGAEVEEKQPVEEEVTETMEEDIVESVEEIQEELVEEEEIIDESEEEKSEQEIDRQEETEKQEEEHVEETVEDSVETAIEDAEEEIELLQEAEDDTIQEEVTDSEEEEKIEINIPENEEEEIADESELNFNLTGEETKEETKAEASTPAAATEVDTSGFKKILVIDDSLVIRKMVEIALEDEEFNISTAVSGKEGLDIMDKTNPDLVILDMMLPDINGIEILKTIKASKGVPVIMLSGKDSPQMIETAKNEGAEEFLPKPFKDDDLVEKIKKLI